MSGVVPDREIPKISHQLKPAIPSPFAQIQSTREAIFNQNAIFATPFGYGEGYFSNSPDTPEYLSWESGEQEYTEGMWKVPKKSSKVPWPLAREGDHPKYFKEFIEKLIKTEENLYKNDSFINEDVKEMECLFCKFRCKKAIHFVLKLNVYKKSTELRWPLIYTHYLMNHKILPSQFFATVFLGFQPLVEED